MQHSVSQRVLSVRPRPLSVPFEIISFIASIFMRLAIVVGLSATLLSAPIMAASKVERWTATSSTAMGITGDIALSPTRLVAAGKAFSLAVAADITNFATSEGPQAARILRVTRPINLILKNGNKLCGTAVRWIAVYRSDHGKSLNMVAFTGKLRPNGEMGSDLCGTFLYTR